MKSLNHSLTLVWILWRLARRDLLRPLLKPRFFVRTILAILAFHWRGKIPEIATGKFNQETDGAPVISGWAAMLQELGPSFVKFGQSLATRADLIGEPLSRELSMLQDRLPAFPYAQAVAIIETDLGKPLDQLFREFSPSPIAAASIAQVHFAVTIEGDEVAVKLLRPGIIAKMERDLALFEWLAIKIEKWLPRTRRLKPRAVIQTLKESVAIELDLRMEAAAASELGENFADDLGFSVPKVYWHYSSARMVCFSRVHGIGVNNRAALMAAGLDIRVVMTNAAASFFNQVFRDGFFHADLHPGNLFVGERGNIIAVDFGIMGRLDRQTRLFLADMLLGFLMRDYMRVSEVHFKAGYIPANQSVEQFAQACRAIGEPILDQNLSQISLGKLMGQLFKVTEQFQMETQPHLLLLQKTMVIAEGVGRMLDPTLNMWVLAQPLIEQWMRENRGIEARIKNMAIGLVDLVEQLQYGIKLHPETVRLLAKELHRASEDKTMTKKK